ncbi:DNA repair protein complementing XP-C cells-like protein [Auxenochlorella protothecoides]|uniref:DNA repair protein complementing XP-C cells-like protein n=1 Tax=Auxenochlorella protothecoides TaxID=3075 RepID=A0A087SFJ3_AUXPR|nr:DNA repair protein complementing XP-C cells-like protein [Auxenochlorella protothecoides]KFM24497.1 DNA repair protein complementing XP-C cells-like protein [Auxenochlorella protothecoides]
MSANDASLAQASHGSLSAALQRRTRKTGRTTSARLLPTTAACGAAAVVDRDAAILATPAELEENTEPAWLDWEEVGHESPASGGEGAGPAPIEAPASQGLGLSISLIGEGAPKPPAKRRGVSQADREAAQRLHRSHALCLLGRALLYDAASSDAGLQARAVILSLLPPELAGSSPIPRADPSQRADPAQMGELLAWFRGGFRPLRRSAVQVTPADGEDALGATLRAARGIPAVVEQLQRVAAQRTGSVEELVAVFVAALRALGIAARTVRALCPCPLRPSVMREEAGEVGARRLAGRPRKAAAAAADADSRKESAQAGKSQKPRRRKGRPNPGVDVSLDAGPSSATPAACGKRRRGDEELEQQLAMAMAATAFQQPVKEDGSTEGAPREPSTGFLSRNSARPEPQTGVLSVSTPGIGRFWVEVLVEGTAAPRWVQADPITGWWDRAADVERLHPSGRSLAYVVGCRAGGAKDLTRRYAANWVAAGRLRDGRWWDATLDPLRRLESRAAHLAAEAKEEPAVGACHSTDHLPAVSLAAREDDELAHRALQHERSVPRTQEGFRAHGVYVLERHIPKHQALRPGVKAHGMHRGEAYYVRKDLADVHTQDRWRRLGRDGEWQTRVAVPLAARNGKVPRNAMGNVEVPPLAHALPLGTVHLDLPSVFAVCQALRVDAAPALAGFEHRGGRATPCLRGVVVAAEHEGAVLELYWRQAREREARAEARRRQAAEAAWRSLLRALLARVRLQARYGEEGAGQGGSMQDAAATLLEPEARGGTTGTDGAYAPPRPQKPDTPEDRAARLAAAEAAQSRQAKFEHSAVGRATLKSVKAVQAERQAGRPPAGKDTAGDWLS